MARIRITEWNAAKLVARVPKVLKDYGPVIGEQLQQEIGRKQFDWPVSTLRKSGQLVPKGLRDIVDTGELLGSQSPPMVQGSSLRIEWGAPYSGEVLRGGYLIGTVRSNYVAPARDWITPALQAQDPAKFFAARWRELGRGA